MPYMTNYEYNCKQCGTETLTKKPASMFISDPVIFIMINWLLDCCDDIVDCMQKFISQAYPTLLVLLNI